MFQRFLIYLAEGTGLEPAGLDALLAFQASSLAARSTL